MPPRTRPGTTKTMGKAEPKSRSKAKAASERADKDQQEQVDEGSWPRNADGSPMAKIEFSAAELIPNGQFANVSVGPAKATVFVDLDSDTPFSDAQKQNLAAALNELADVVGLDVIGVQRNLVHESLQEQIASDNNK